MRGFVDWRSTNRFALAGEISETVCFMSVCILSPIFLKLALVLDNRHAEDGRRSKVQRSTTAIFVLVVMALVNWLLIVWNVAYSLFILPVLIVAALAVTVHFVRRVKRNQSMPLWHGHLDLAYLHFAAYFVFRGLIVSCRDITAVVPHSTSHLMSFAIKFGTPAIARAVIWLTVLVMNMSASLLAEELAVLVLTLQGDSDADTLALAAAANVLLLVLLSSGLANVFSWSSGIPLRDLYGNSLFHYLTRQLSARGPRRRKPSTSSQPSKSQRRADMIESFSRPSSDQSLMAPPSPAATLSAMLASPTTDTPGSDGRWTPALIARVHERLQGHADVAHQYHLARVIAVACIALFRLVALQAEMPTYWIQWVHSFIPLAAMAFSYAVAAAIVGFLYHRKIRNLGFDRVRVLTLDSVPLVSPASTILRPKLTSQSLEVPGLSRTSTNVTDHVPLTRQETRTSVKPMASPTSPLGLIMKALAGSSRARAASGTDLPAAPHLPQVVQLDPIRMGRDDLWECTSPSLVLWLVVFSVMIQLSPSSR
ncbi:hypothetical protein AMAG_17235 [Allomyces macrogynus ATCC 38327]|uniref:Uncharacterized protein n=1 Tax=Allomyces macrogynus (strain ATCC 38327) TaxID=578462 RepID=A0A0L0TEJ3_ALLM3|nr:hypothetical protein AMAG_17235 [Allomyces macrogynus ATCC 38327]|eukprot:KNE73081.1 hypothetical protein AMAG_17235 [Allomyces macrogynus ATCC 38327]